jgi:UDP-2-acetamido-3-amino-2,3-dideoxy-glucuronate N-acetyltransferase
VVHKRGLHQPERKAVTDISFYAHPTAEIATDAQIGAGTKIWRDVQIREQASIGANCNISKGVYIDRDVHISSNVKIQNHASIFEGVTLEDGVFVGPHVCFTNDLFPRAITPDGKLKTVEDWQITPTLVKYGASIGAGAVILCGVTIGTFALIGAGSMVTRDVPAYGLVFGNPARLHGYVCRCARRLTEVHEQDGQLMGWCQVCEQKTSILTYTS